MPCFGLVDGLLLGDFVYADVEVDRGMGHSACLEELDDVEAFLLKQLPPTEKK